MSVLRFKLCLLYFLQFAVWGCYLTSLGQFLGAGGLGADIAWFYAAIGMVSLVTPSLSGHIADRFVSPEKLLGLFHLTAALCMTGLWGYATLNPEMEFAPAFTLYLLFLAFYMPTLALANTTAFKLLRNSGLRPVDEFPSIRVWGTVGFVIAMWFVNSAYFYDGSFGFTMSDSNPAAPYRFQYTPMQLLSSASIGLVTSLYTLTLPHLREIKESNAEKASLSEIFGLKAFTLFKEKSLRTFLIFAIFIGVCLQISNGFATPFITHFMAIPEFAGSLAAGNATMLFSLSQISEAACVLLVGVTMKRLGFRWVIGIAMLAWTLRFLLFGFGDPGAGLWMLIASMAVYGIAFNFFNIAGHIYMEQSVPARHKGFGQGLLMMMSNGIGATFGTLGAGTVVNRFCHWETAANSAGGMSRFFMGDWEIPWLIFAAYSLAIGLLFILLYRNTSRPS